MTDAVDLKAIEHRSTKYWDIDGLPELIMGLMWMVWGGAMVLGRTLPRGAVWNVYWAFMPALLALSGVAANWAIKRLKARLTFPRAGYVSWKEPTRAARLATAGVALIAAAVIAGLAVKSRIDGIDRVAVPGLGVLLSLGFLVVGIRQHAPHMLALAGVAVMLGLAFGAMRAGWDAMNWLLIALGAASVLVGAVRLRAFLRHYPLAARP